MIPNVNKITIEIIANGFLVCLPSRYTMTEEYMEAQIRKEAEINAMIDGVIDQTEDPVLRKLQGKTEIDLSMNEIPLERKFRKYKNEEIKDDGVLFFKTLPEALDFIKKEFEH